METNSISNTHGNFKELRNMWSSKSQEQDKPLQPPAAPSPLHSAKEKSEQESFKGKIPILKITNAATKEESPVISTYEKKLMPVQETMSQSILPLPPPTAIFRHQAETVTILKQSIKNMSLSERKNLLSKDRRNTGMHHWHIIRHVFRSGLIFNRARRASDSILPLLLKTHSVKRHSRTYSMDSTLSETPFGDLVDYLTYNNDDEKSHSMVLTKVTRSISDTSECLQRNKLDDVIFQYEMILRHLKNYEQFTTEYPVTSSAFTAGQRPQSFDNELKDSRNKTKENLLAKSSIYSQKTQSLSRNIGRTFSDFITTDLLLSSVFRTPSNEQKHFSVSHASSQTDLSESIHDPKDEINDSAEMRQNPEFHRINSTADQEVTQVLNELDTMLDQQSPVTPNTDISVIVHDAPVSPSAASTPPTEKPLMQRLFEGKKTAYKPADVQMESIRLPAEMMPVYDIAKKRCFFDTEMPVYTTTMLKVRRRSYTQHTRIFCITTARIYNITKKNSYPKETVLLKDIIGVTCTPYSDGFICIHTKECREDRGDWLVVVDHPCELITQLFMILERTNNDDQFLKISPKFKHCCRFYSESFSNDCSIEARLADTFRIKKAGLNSVIIYTP